METSSSSSTPCTKKQICTAGCRGEGRSKAGDVQQLSSFTCKKSQPFTRPSKNIPSVTKNPKQINMKLFSFASSQAEIPSKSRQVNLLWGKKNKPKSLRVWSSAFCSLIDIQRTTLRSAKVSQKPDSPSNMGLFAPIQAPEPTLAAHSALQSMGFLPDFFSSSLVLEK